MLLTLQQEIIYTDKGTPHTGQNILYECDRCGIKLDNRRYTGYINSNKKWNGDYCNKCINHFINNTPETIQKQKDTHNRLIKQYTKEERSKKFGNGAWKSNEAWKVKQKSNEGHGDVISKTVQKMSDEERKRKYGCHGKDNPMYGKLAPKGSGFGYSGYYNDLFFRSFLELSFLVENDGKDIKNAEDKISIKYIFDGVDRTYKPDFIIGNTVIEVKPLNFINDKNNVIKFREADKWCKNNNYKYVIVVDEDIKVLSIIEIKELLKSGNVKLSEKQNKRFIKNHGEYMNES